MGSDLIIHLANYFTEADIEGGLKTAGELAGKGILGTITSEFTKKLFHLAETKIFGAGKESKLDNIALDHVEAIHEKASRVSDPDLQDLWSELLAKALVGEQRYLKKAYYETLSELSPVEASVLRQFGDRDTASFAYCDAKWDSDLLFLKNRPYYAGYNEETEELISAVQERSEYFCQTLDILDIDNVTYEIARDGLVRAGILKLRPGSGDETIMSCLTSYGNGLIRALSDTWRKPPEEEYLQVYRDGELEDVPMSMVKRRPLRFVKPNISET